MARPRAEDGRDAASLGWKRAVAGVPWRRSVSACIAWYSLSGKDTVWTCAEKAEPDTMAHLRWHTCNCLIIITQIPRQSPKDAACTFSKNTSGDTCLFQEFPYWGPYQNLSGAEFVVGPLSLGSHTVFDLLVLVRLAFSRVARPLVVMGVQLCWPPWPALADIAYPKDRIRQKMTTRLNSPNSVNFRIMLVRN